MEKGYLSDYFTGVVCKHLTDVEIDPLKSNQHEFNGTKALKQLLGSDPSKQYLETTFLFLDDDKSIQTKGNMTWYDARQNNPDRSEFRLYYKDNISTAPVDVGDEVFIAKKRDGTVITVFTKNNSTTSNQLKWLFGLNCEQDFTFTDKYGQNSINFITDQILESMGVHPDLGETGLEEVIDIFPEFPTTNEFSRYARGTLNLDPTSDPDDLVVSWMDRENTLFRIVENSIVKRTLDAWQLQEPTTDDFLKFSLSVQNRRKSRAGFALENHLEEIFKERGILYTRNGITEHNNKPDFIFSGIDKYLDPNFPAQKLSMLGVKTTCKDRWRQILPEANRIKNKHLITLEPAISITQLEQMESENVQLVVPKSIQKTYPSEKRSWLMSLNEFCEIVESKQ